MTADFQPDAYEGWCEICGVAQQFERTKRAIRETYRCTACKALLRERAQAAVIVSCFAPHGSPTLKDLVQTPRYKALRVYEPGVAGSLRPWLRSAVHYRQSDFLAPELRHFPPNGIPHEDLEALSLADDSVDLVVSSDILEHVRRPGRAFSEIGRVLKRGGRHIFTVPMQEPLSPLTIARVDTTTEVDVPVLPPHYHGDGKGGRSLVYTDFGADIVQMLERAGFEAVLVRHSSPSVVASRAITVLATRI